MANEKFPTGKEWYVVAGFRGDEDDVTQENADFIVVQADDLQSSLIAARHQDAMFSAISALSESDLLMYLGKIKAVKNEI